MSVAGNIIALTIGAGLIGSLAWMLKEDRSARGWDADEFFGDWPHLTREIVEIGGQQEPGGGAGDRPATDIHCEIAPHDEATSR